MLSEGDGTQSYQTEVFDLHPKRTDVTGDPAPLPGDCKSCPNCYYMLLGILLPEGTSKHFDVGSLTVDVLPGQSVTALGCALVFDCNTKAVCSKSAPWLGNGLGKLFSLI